MSPLRGEDELENPEDGREEMEDSPIDGDHEAVETNVGPEKEEVTAGLVGSDMFILSVRSRALASPISSSRDRSSVERAGTSVSGAHSRLPQSPQT